MPTYGQYHPCIEGLLNEAEQRYLAACFAYTEALLDQEVAARLMPYRQIDYPDGDLPVAPLTRAYPGGPLTPLHLLSALARAHPDVAGERVQHCRAEAEAAAEEYMALLEDAAVAWELDPEDAIELEAE
jgi:hypothetical protein